MTPSSSSCPSPLPTPPTLPAPPSLPVPPPVHRKLFHVFSYFLFFHNIVIGLGSSFLRIILSMFFGVLFFFRLDRVVLMKGLERVDTGEQGIGEG